MKAGKAIVPRELANREVEQAIDRISCVEGSKDIDVWRVLHSRRRTPTRMIEA